MSEEKNLADVKPLELKVCSLKAYALAEVIANNFQDELTDLAFQLYSSLELGISIPNEENWIMNCVESLVQRVLDKNIPGCFVDDEIRKEVCMVLFSAFAKFAGHGNKEYHLEIDHAEFIFDKFSNKDVIKSKALQYFHHLVKTVEDDRASLSVLNKIMRAPYQLYFIVDKISYCRDDLLIKPYKDDAEEIFEIDDQIFDVKLNFMLTHPIFGRLKETIKTFFCQDFEGGCFERLLELPNDVVMRVVPHLFEKDENFYDHVVLVFPRHRDEPYGKIITQLILLEENDENFVKFAEANYAAVLDDAINKKNIEFISRYLSIVSLDALNRILQILPKRTQTLLQKHLTYQYYRKRLKTACKNNDYRSVHDYLSILNSRRDQDPRYKILLIFRKISLPILFGGSDEIDTESNYYHCFEQSFLEYLDYIQLNYETNDERLVEKHVFASQWLGELLNPELSGKEKLSFIKNHLEELLRKNPEAGIRKNRGTGGYFWYGFFNGIKNPFDNRYSRSTTETKAIELYESLISLQQSIPENNEVLYEVHSLSSAGG